MFENYVCEHDGGPSEIIPKEYNDEFDKISENPLWPAVAYIIRKDCLVKPFEEFTHEDVIETTEHLALIRK